MDPILYIIIPCYNEEEVLPITCEMFLEKLTSLIGKGKISDDSRILFVNDGSKDKTWDIICGLAERDVHFKGISQSRNRGHQNAVLAGLMDSIDKCDMTISIDCDGHPGSFSAFFPIIVLHSIANNRESQPIIATIDSFMNHL